jgi:ubiquinone/menaquinone biosynthesis C-methylase UbiE
MNASAWSQYSRQYNGPSNVAMTLPMVQSAFRSMWFDKLDNMVAAKGAPVKVLALACGTGAEIEALCSRYNESQLSVLATDYAEGMVQMTQSCVDRLGKQDMVKVKLMDAMVRACVLVIQTPHRSS